MTFWHCAHHLNKVDISSKSDKGFFLFRSGAVKNSLHVTDLHFYLKLEAGCLKLLLLSSRGEHLCEIFNDLTRSSGDTERTHIMYM